MNISIAFSWPAGGGVNTAWLMLAEVLSQKWYKILVDKEYASIIKWDNNSIIVYISDDKPFISKSLDYFICFDDYSITKNEKIYELKNIVNLKTYPSKYKNTPAFWVAIKILENALNIKLKDWEKILTNFFKKELLGTNKQELKNWYQLNIEVPLFALAWKRGGGDLETSQQLFYGNEIIAKWAMESGLDRYSAYPMTPASTLIDVITTQPSSWVKWNETKDINLDSSLRSEWHKVIFFQWEDEIAVAISMLWAKFAGKRAMCGTSGWWFALMTESISFSNQAEIGWVYILSQRDWPSTGTPTFTGQWDMDFALNASFGETYPIVIYPDTFENWYNLIWKALNWSDMYQHPVIYITDKQFSESYLSIDPKTLKAEPINRWDSVPNVILSETKDIKNNLDSSPTSQNDNLIGFKRYQFTDSWISPYTIPWLENWEFITTSYEHDEYWATNEDPKIKKQMTEKRANKIKTFVENEFNKDFYGYEIINPNAKKFFVTFGFNRYVLEYLIASDTSVIPSDTSVILNEVNNPVFNYIDQSKIDSSPGRTAGSEWQFSDYWLIVVTVLQPLDPRLKKWFQENEQNIEELTFVEMNYGWIFQKLISNECNLRSESREKKIKSIRKYDLYPIFEEDIK